MTRRTFDGGVAHPSQRQVNRQQRLLVLCRMIINHGCTKKECIYYSEEKWGVSRVTASALAADAIHIVNNSRRLKSSVGG